MSSTTETIAVFQDQSKALSEERLSQITSKLFLRGAKEEAFGDFRDDLLRDGFAVVKGAVPRERADDYADQMFQWLEDFNLGYKRNDPSTIHEDHLPVISEKGMVFGYGASHEKWSWAVRQEPGVVGAFEKVHNTEDLVVSFDTVNLSFPNRKDLEANKPWAHQDQDPLKPGFRCLQGLVNLLPNGPEDGGLIVCKGAHLLSEEFHKKFVNEPKIWAWTKEWYGFSEAGLKWLADRGCKWEKVCMESGDLVVWDSRTPHFNVSPSEKSTQPRFAVYTCYMPVADLSQDELKSKKKAFEEMDFTTHWPNLGGFGGVPFRRLNGEACPHNYKEPKSGRPVLTERGYRLTGIPYIKEE